MKNITHKKCFYDITRRSLKRYLWVATATIGIIALILILTAFTNNQPTTAKKSFKALESKISASPYTMERSDQTTTTTTTTTTTPRVERRVQAVPKVVPTTIPAPPITGDKSEWLAQSIIPPADWVYVDYIISHESGWRPGAVNSRGCIGLGQNCPWEGKLFLSEACPDWQTNPVCQLNRWNGYATKYGGWKASYNHWMNNKNW